MEADPMHLLSLVVLAAFTTLPHAQVSDTPIHPRYTGGGLQPWPWAPAEWAKPTPEMCQRSVPVPTVTPPPYCVTEQKQTVLGEIFIVGNDKTPNSVILKLTGFCPGENLSYPLLRLAEQRLVKSGRFKVNEQEGIRPTVTVIEREDGTDVRDILIRVQEKERRNRE
jgi:hypothetical protein